MSNIPQVIFFACLDLEQVSEPARLWKPSFPDGHYSGGMRPYQTIDISMRYGSTANFRSVPGVNRQ